MTGAAAGKLPEKLSLLWKFDAKGPVKASAVIANGMAYVGGDDDGKKGLKGKLYAIDLATGKQAWDFTCNDPIEASAMVLDGRVYAGSVDGFVYALDAKTGKELWKFETGDQITGAPNWTSHPTARRPMCWWGVTIFSSTVWMPKRARRFGNMNRRITSMVRRH